VNSLMNINKSNGKRFAVQPYRDGWKVGVEVGGWTGSR